MKNNSTIILSGGGSEKQSLILDNFFFKSIPKNGSILYIPTALIGHRMYNGAENWFKSVINLHERNDLTLETLIDFKNHNDLDKYDAIYIGGGNTWKLRKIFKENNFDSNILNFISKNKILYGGSAGAIIFGEDISCQDDESILDPFVEGLNIVDNYSIACHYEDRRDNEINSWCKINNKKIIAIPENSGIIFAEDKFLVLGSSDCFIFNGDKKEVLK